MQMVDVKWKKNKPVELEHTHLICIIFLYKRFRLSRIRSLCHWWQPFAIRCYWCQFVLMPSKWWYERYEQSRFSAQIPKEKWKPLLLFLFVVAIAAYINIRVVSLLRHNRYYCSFYFLLFIGRNDDSFTTLKRRNIFWCTNEINT